MTPATTDVKRKPEETTRYATAGPLSPDELRKMHACWRAANYLSVGQIYLMDNPLLKEQLALKHVKPCPFGFEHDRRDQPIIRLWNYVSEPRE